MSLAMLNLLDQYADADLQCGAALLARFILKIVHDYLAKATANAIT